MIAVGDAYCDRKLMHGEMSTT